MFELDYTEKRKNKVRKQKKKNNKKKSTHPAQTPHLCTIKLNHTVRFKIPWHSDDNCVALLVLTHFVNIKPRSFSIIIKNYFFNIFYVF